MSDGYYNSKKTDDICEDVCGRQASGVALSMSRVKCFARVGFEDLCILVCGCSIRIVWIERGKPLVEEAYQRVVLDQLIRIAGIEDDDLLIMSDVDEIPSAHTINLLRWCDDIPPILHLQLRNYLYSFEYYVDNKSWRASVHNYRTGKTRYAHYRQADVLLSDSGWHCSFCFRYISDFIFKMKAYSHYDRVRFSHYLNPKGFRM
ncbi:hypothetical protein GH714_009739 [Hevea brasiliensis]|uniref:Uncharacterized protein n=1 Tax=Hevea brasiliensis TaxID=3981 RepID=A0A6A6M7S1_HEVBR|nr:hypothetical protein GH714_009739 [Hevea brasiliensis]